VKSISPHSDQTTSEPTLLRRAGISVHRQTVAMVHQRILVRSSLTSQPHARRILRHTAAPQRSAFFPSKSSLLLAAVTILLCCAVAFVAAQDIPLPPSPTPGGGEAPVTPAPTTPTAGGGGGGGTNNQNTNGNSNIIDSDNPDTAGGPTARGGFPAWAIVITASAAALVLLFFCLRFQNPRATHFDVIIFFLALLDAFSDVWFIYTLRDNIDLHNIFIAAIIFTSAPFVINFLSLMYCIYGEMGNLAFRRWLNHNFAPFTAVTLVACTNIDAMFILDSHVCGLPCFSAPWSDHIRALIRMFGLCTILFEDIPQACLQIYVISSSNYQLVNIVALAFSCLNIFFGTTKRALVCCVYQFDKKHDLEAQNGTQTNGGLLHPPAQDVAMMKIKSEAEPGAFLPTQPEMVLADQNGTATYPANTTDPSAGGIQPASVNAPIAVYTGQPMVLNQNQEGQPDSEPGSMTAQQQHPMSPTGFDSNAAKVSPLLKRPSLTSVHAASPSTATPPQPQHGSDVVSESHAAALRMEQLSAAAMSSVRAASPVLRPLIPFSTRPQTPLSARRPSISETNAVPARRMSTPQASTRTLAGPQPSMESHHAQVTNAAPVLASRTSTPDGRTRTLGAIVQNKDESALAAGVPSKPVLPPRPSSANNSPAFLTRSLNGAQSIVTTDDQMRDMPRRHSKSNAPVPQTGRTFSELMHIRTAQAQ
jgi:hypothetical protein